MELPAAAECDRIGQAALRGFFQGLYTRITARLSEAVRTILDQLLTAGPGETPSMFDKCKAESAAPGVKHLQEGCTTLQRLRAVGLPPDALADMPAEVLQTLTRRGLNEAASKMRVHPTPIRYALLACVRHVRTMEVTDAAVRLLLEIIRRMETQQKNTSRRNCCGT
jgi:hypothetical protein